ncbi:MAG: iron-sulfur cluster assembly scaffold protein [Novosphingobium sp.]|nr:iron-sulfur cluster assembly scaffold protein [Novosphingobium sp.]
MARHGSARSAACGSTMQLTLTATDEGRIAEIGLQAQACAIGQASAAIFAAAAQGRSLEEISSTARQLQGWLAGQADMPDWPGLATIAAARDYPARHGAILLPWQAALDALSSAAKLG